MLRFLQIYLQCHNLLDLLDLSGITPYILFYTLSCFSPYHTLGTYPQGVNLGLGPKAAYLVYFYFSLIFTHFVGLIRTHFYPYPNHLLDITLHISLWLIFGLISASNHAQTMLKAWGLIFDLVVNSQQMAKMAIWRGIIGGGLLIRTTSSFVDEYERSER